MRESLKDPLRLEHIRDAIDRLLAADANKPFDLLDDKDIEYFGVVKLLEIIGEASYKLTVEFKESHPDTPWKFITGMRHVLVHGYYQIKQRDVIKTVRKDLPVLRNQIIDYLSEFDEK